MVCQADSWTLWQGYFCCEIFVKLDHVCPKGREKEGRLVRRCHHGVKHCPTQLDIQCYSTYTDLVLVQIQYFALILLYIFCLV